LNLEQVYDECHKIDEKLKQLAQNSSFGDTDNRKHAFGVLCSQMIHYEMMLHVLHARYSQIIQPPNVFQEVFGIGYDEQPQWDEFQIISKVSYITLTQFVIENFFKTLLSELNTSQDPPTGFYKIVETLFDKITILDKQQKKDILNTMAMVRNSLHSNGIHVPLHPSLNSKSVTIGSQTFTFNKGQSTSISESQMIVLINEVINILDEIVKSVEIQRLGSVPILFTPKF